MPTIQPIKSVKLKDITSKIGSGATPRGGKNSYITEGIALIRSLNVYDFSFAYEDLAFIDEKQANQLENVSVEIDDILLNITGASVCRCCLVPKNVLPARVNQHVSIVRIKPRAADARYVLYAINSPYNKRRLLAIAQGGATREALTKEKIENFEIPIPPLPTQEKIAAILSAYDDLIENNLRRIKILEEMAQSLYREWFVKFHFPGRHRAKMVNSPLGKIPEGWEIKQLDEVCGYIARGVTPKYLQDSGRFIINQKSNRGSSIQREKLKELTPDLEVPEEKLARKGDLLVNSLGEGTIGRVHYFQGPDNRWAVDQHMTICRSAAPGVTLYFYLKLSSEEGQGWIHSVKTGATNMTMLNISTLRALEAMVPPSEMLSRFSDICQPFFDQRFLLEEKNLLLRQTRDLFLPKLISGELDVSELDISIPEANV